MVPLEQGPLRLAPVRVAFVYPNPRARLIAEVEAGTSPDTGLLGENHLHDLGVDAIVHDSRIRRSTPSNPLVHRLTWHGRELTLPWELGDVDVVVTSLSNLLPLAAKLHRRPRIVLLSYHLVSAWDRAGSARRVLQRASLNAAAGTLAISTAARERLIEAHGAGAGEDQDRRDRGRRSLVAADTAAERRLRPGGRTGPRA